jgi:hypothetical protein
MDAPGSLSQVDLVTRDEVVALARVDGPCVSVFMPTHRHGPETLQGPIRLRNLADQAARTLTDDGHDAPLVDQLLGPVRALIDDADFWQHQSDGLAVFAAPGWSWHARVPLDLREEVTVAPSFRVAPLIPLLSGGGRFFLLAVSQNAIRLFDAGRHRISELDLGPIPASIDEALAHEDPERQLQVRSSGGPAGQFHGHGAGDEVDKATIERFLRAVDHGLRERIGPSDQPLVLASVAYYLPIFQAVSSYPNLVDAAVEGNPDHRSAEELHAAAWPIVEERFTAGLERELDRFGTASGTGLTATDPDEVAAMAQQGRVDTLLVADGVEPDARVDAAVLDTLVNGGRVVGVEAAVADTPAAALLRA